MSVHQDGKWVFSVTYDPETEESVITRSKEFDYTEQLLLYKALTLFMLQFASEYDIDEFVGRYSTGGYKSLKESDKKLLPLKVFKQIVTHEMEEFRK